MGSDKHIRIIFSIFVCVSILFSLLTITPQSVFGEVSHADDISPRIVSVANDFSFVGIAKTDEQISLNLQKN